MLLANVSSASHRTGLVPVEAARVCRRQLEQKRYDRIDRPCIRDFYVPQVGASGVVSREDGSQDEAVPHGAVVFPYEMFSHVAVVVLIGICPLSVRYESIAPTTASSL